MKEVTRIHIAKISYDAELEAKKELESYLKALEAYSEDGDILDDVEVRMTEILTERGVKKGGVITHKDILALKEQLGEPRDFMSEGDMAVGPDDEVQINTEASRKLFRDTDHAVLGGVLSGIAAFFKVSPALIRILFIIVALASFGTALLVYIVLWIAVPPAKTTADKLQMNGEAVTLSSIRRLNESEAGKPSSNEGRKVLLALLGVFSIMGALGAAAVTLFVAWVVLFGHFNHVFQMNDGAGFMIAAFVLMVSSGLLLTILFSLAAYASFAAKLTKRVGVSMIIVTVLGMLTFGTALGLGQYASLRYGDAVKANVKEEVLALPAGVEKIDSLAVDAPGLHVTYIASTDTPHASFRVLPVNNQKNVDIKLEGSVLKISGQNQKKESCHVFWCEGPFVTIYGPALANVTADKKADVEYLAGTQKQLMLTTQEGAEATLSKGIIDSLTVQAGVGSEVLAGAASITSVTATTEHGANIELGTVANLTLTNSMACPNGRSAIIELSDVTSNKMIVNGQQLAAKSTRSGCYNINVENDRE
jgi:phage shock protein PspC (stress-responsive transcriptional regulator)